MNKEKFDAWWIGLTGGIVAPAIGFFIYFLLNFRYMGISHFINFIISGRIYSQMISLSVIANLPLFFLFLQFDLYKSARGVLMTTILLTIFNYILKFSV